MELFSHTAFEHMSIGELLVVLLGGAFGAIVKDVLQDNAIELPMFQGGKLMLGFIGGAIVGAFVGVVIDGSFVTALLAGYTGTSVIGKLLDSGNGMSRSVDEPVSPITGSAPDAFPAP